MAETLKIKQRPQEEQPIFKFIRETSFFSNLSDKEISRFQNAAKSRTYKKGKILYVQNEPAEFFYVICSGWMKLFHTLPEGEEVIVDMLTTGHVAGESAVFEDNRQTSSAEIIEDVRLLSIPSKLLKEEIQNNAALAFSMLSAMSRNHRRLYNEIALKAMQTAPQRIGCFLLRLCPHKQEKDIAILLPYDKTLIAYTLGMKGATFSRALHILRHKTNLRIKGTRVEIDCLKQLVEFVYGSVSEQFPPNDL